MRSFLSNSKKSAVAALALLSMPLWGQWTKLPTAGVPRSANGQANLSAPAPKTRDGKPDLSGIWEPQENKYVRNIAADLKPDAVPFQPWAKALYDQRTDGSH